MGQSVVVPHKLEGTTEWEIPKYSSRFGGVRGLVWLFGFLGQLFQFAEISKWKMTLANIPPE